MLSIALFLQLAFVSVPASVIFEDCGSAYELLSVNIDGCGTRLPCYVTLGEEVPVSVKFQAGFLSRQLDQDVVININLVNLNTEVSPDPCEVVDCPVRIDALSSFTSVMSVPTKIALNQRGYLRWRVYNENQRLVLCYSVLVQTQSPLQKLLRQALAQQIPDGSISPDLDDYVNTIGAANINSYTSNLNCTEGYLQYLIDQYFKKSIDD